MNVEWMNEWMFVLNPDLLWKRKHRRWMNGWINKKKFFLVIGISMWCLNFYFQRCLKFTIFSFVTNNSFKDLLNLRNISILEVGALMTSRMTSLKSTENSSMFIFKIFWIFLILTYLVFVVRLDSFEFKIFFIICIDGLKLSFKVNKRLYVKYFLFTLM